MGFIIAAIVCVRRGTGNLIVLREIVTFAYYRHLCLFMGINSGKGPRVILFPIQIKGSREKIDKGNEQMADTKNTVHTEFSADIDAPPAEIYAIFADYRGAHAQIVPKPEFGDILIEKGGHGAGTVYRTSVTVMGTKTEYYMEVSEPEPGRKIVETDKILPLTTSFIIDPLEGGQKSRVTLATDWTPSSGIKGWIEKMSTPGVMRKLYKRELQNVQEYVTKKKQDSGGGFK
jgi:hypothetical protein